MLVIPRVRDHPTLAQKVVFGPLSDVPVSGQNFVFGSLNFFLVVDIHYKVPPGAPPHWLGGLPTHYPRISRNFGHPRPSGSIPLHLDGNEVENFSKYEKKVQVGSSFVCL